MKRPVPSMLFSENYLLSTIYQIPGVLHNPVPKSGGSCSGAPEFGTLVIFSGNSVFLWMDLPAMLLDKIGPMCETGSATWR
jgi:hypothetical protein